MVTERDEFIGDRIRRLREAKRLSQLDLRRLAGLSQSTVYRAEVGGVVSRETARKLAAVLGIDSLDVLPKNTGRP